MIAGGEFDGEPHVVMGIDHDSDAMPAPRSKRQQIGDMPRAAAMDTCSSCTERCGLGAVAICAVHVPGCEI